MGSLGFHYSSPSSALSGPPLGGGRAVKLLIRQGRMGEQELSFLPPWLMRETGKHSGHLEERSRFLPGGAVQGWGCISTLLTEKQRDSQVRTSRMGAQGGPESQSPYPPGAHRGAPALLVLSCSVMSSSLY